MLDLTVYLVGPDESELDFLVRLYTRACPRDRLSRYKIAEFEHWPTVANPALTASGRQAAAHGLPTPALEPVRRRIRDGRAFELRFWDGREIDAAEGSWSFSCTRIHLRRSGLHAFVRILIPLEAGPQILPDLARAIARNVRFLSGNGGLTFAYQPWHKAVAFDHIFAMARRFWGVDIEDLNASLPLMREGLKSIGWITMLGQVGGASAGSASPPAFLANPIDNVTITTELHGVIMLVGAEPVAGDINRQAPELSPYFTLARCLEPLVLAHHPDFDGDLFAKSGGTVDWIRRFIDPQGWR